MGKYKWNADEYSRYSSAQHKWAREVIAKVSLQKDEHVLDVGCGDGKVTAEIAAYVPEGTVLGIDNSAAMINFANDKFPKSKFPNLSFLVGDAKNLKYINQFDVILSNAALHWVDDHQKVLNGMYNSLKTGGRILLQMGGKGNIQEAFNTLNKMKLKDEWLPYLHDFKSPYNFYSIEEYYDLLAQTDFKKIKVDLVEKDMLHKGEEGLKGWIRTTWLPITEKIPFEKREEFIHHTYRAFANDYPSDNEDVFHVKAKRLIVEGEK